MRPAVFLDRDGVLNIPVFRDGRSYAPRRVADFHLYPEAADAVGRLGRAGFLVVVVTNQPDIGANLVSAADVEKMHERLMAAMSIDAIELCPDTREQAASAARPRRKPAPGMLLDAAERLGIDLPRSFMVGDRTSDIEAGLAAGCRATVFIDRGYTVETRPHDQAATVTDLGMAVTWILAEADKLALEQTNDRRIDLRTTGGSDRVQR